MKTQDLLNLTNSKETKEKLQKVLSKIKWLEKYEPEEITLEVMESLFKRVSEKYQVQIGYIQTGSEKSMICMLKSKVDHSWVGTVYFQSFWECMAKVIVMTYAIYVKGEKL